VFDVVSTRVLYAQCRTAGQAADSGRRIVMPDEYVLCVVHSCAFDCVLMCGVSFVCGCVCVCVCMCGVCMWQPHAKQPDC